MTGLGHVWGSEFLAGVRCLGWPGGKDYMSGR